MDHSKGFGGSKHTETSINTEDLDIFATPTTEHAILGGRTVIYRPLSDHNDGPFTFLVKSQGRNMYAVLNRFRLSGKVKVTNNGVDLSDEDAKLVAAVNMWPASIFKAVQVDAGGNEGGYTLLSEYSFPMHHYQTVLQTVASYNSLSTKTVLTSQRFEMDTPKHYDGKFIEAANKGALNRSNNIHKERDFYIPLCSDFLQSDKLLYHKIDLRIQLTREADSFMLMSAEAGIDYKVILSDLKLHVHYVQLHEALISRHESTIEKMPLIYPMIRTQLLKYYLNAGATSGHIANMFSNSNTQPKSIIIAMVDTDAFEGSVKKNPYHFKHYDVDSISLRVNGEMNPTEPYKPDFENGNFSREYNEFNRAIGCNDNDDYGNLITPEQYSGGFYLNAFDIPGHGCNMLHRHAAKGGTIDLNLLFKKPLPNNVTLIVYCSYDAHIEIDSTLVPKVIIQSAE